MKLRGLFLLLLIVTSSGCGGRLFQAGPDRALSAAAEPTPAIREVRFEQLGSTPETDTAAEAAPAIAIETDPRLAARVNHQPILLDSYEQQVAQMRPALAAQGVDLTSAAGAEMLAQVKRQLLEALIDQLIIEQQAGQLGLTITEEALENRVQEMMAQGQSQEQFEAWLAANNLTYEQFKQTFRSQLIANQMFERVTAGVPDRAEQIRLRYIQVADEALARSIIDQLKEGADFAALARAQSLDESSRTNDGDLGWFARGLGPIPLEVERIALGLEPGQVSGPIRSGLGLHIIKLEGREADRPLTTEMQQALKKRIFADWLAEQRALTTIERFVAQ